MKTKNSAGDLTAWQSRLAAFDQRWIFRFRNFSPLTLKELYHSEVFFSYDDELSDPLDMHVDLVIGPDERSAHRYFLDAAFQASPYTRGKYHTERSRFVAAMVRELSKAKRELRTIVYGLNQDFIRASYIRSGLPESVFSFYVKSWHSSLLSLYPTQLCSVSFTKESSNPMMWSTYTDGHRGFCLAFLPSRNALKLRRNESGQYKSFEFCKVRYSRNLEVEVSCMFDREGKFDMRLVYDQFLKLTQQKALLTKNPRFRDEREYRVHAGIGTSFSHKLELPQRKTFLERSYHYDPSQLKAILFGMRMQEKNKKEIEAIVTDKRLQVRMFDCVGLGNEVVTRFRSIHA